MKVTTYEATVENGQIRMPESVRLPEHATVYVVVPGVENRPRIHMRSPRLANPEQTVDLVKEMIVEDEDAGL